jgi:hypothetical protein
LEKKGGVAEIAAGGRKLQMFTGSWGVKVKFGDV